MATVTKVSYGISTPNPPDSCKLGPFYAGEDLAANDACYIKSDGKVWRSNGTAATAPAAVHGFTPIAVSAAQRQPVTLVFDVNLPYGASMTPGAYLYLDTTPGGLNTAATTGGTVPVAVVLPDGIRIRVKQSF